MKSFSKWERNNKSENCPMMDSITKYIESKLLLKVNHIK